MARHRARRDDRASRPAAALLAHPRGGSAPESAPGDRKEARRRLSRLPGLHLLPARSLHGPRPLPPVSAGTAVCPPPRGGGVGAGTRSAETGGPPAPAGGG